MENAGALKVRPASPVVRRTAQIRQMVSMELPAAAADGSDPPDALQAAAEPEPEEPPLPDGAISKQQFVLMMRILDNVPEMQTGALLHGRGVARSSVSTLGRFLRPARAIPAPAAEGCRRLAFHALHRPAIWPFVEEGGTNMVRHEPMWLCMMSGPDVAGRDVWIMRASLWLYMMSAAVAADSLSTPSISLSRGAGGPA
jgi:hypothetical protein